MIDNSENTSTQNDFSNAKMEDFVVTKRDGEPVGEVAEEPVEDSEEQEDTINESTDDSDEEVSQDESDDSEEEVEESTDESSEEPVSDTDEESEDSTDIDALISERVAKASNGEFNTIDDLIASVKAPKQETSFKDDFIKKAVDYYNQNGDLTPFLEATTVDFKNMSPVDILKHKMNKDNEGLSQALINRKFKKEILEKYYQDGDDLHDEDDVNFGLEEMTYEAEKVRKDLISSQQEFVNNIESTKDKGTAETARPVVSEELMSFATENISGVVKDGKIALKVGGETIYMPNADPSTIARMGMNPNEELAKLFTSKTQEGKIKVDWDKMARVMVYASNPEAFEKQLFDSGKSFGRDDIEKEIKNPTDRARKSKRPLSSGENPDFTRPEVLDDFAQNAKIIRR